MRKHTILAKAASVAVCFGILLSSTASAFEGGPSPVARDVELTGDGTLHGQIYTSEGRVVENAPIELRYQGTTVARATTVPTEALPLPVSEAGLTICLSAQRQPLSDSGRTALHRLVRWKAWFLQVTKMSFAVRRMMNPVIPATPVLRQVQASV